ncbi:COMM domain-containing protein 8 isoform X2 [Callorhinchus milii]|uniref:COMM domain containing 8 n=2 Tax=Callorhinchus milii TaxID=7868 RepID=A0A4W3IBE2_CALMI|nr:COMM domain-containing protein 8 isoform X2 [Callorhinchus milii]|eukprot:gi/632950730/ref/XP_007890897.1/ PREDICTED: COMM domain-containing protein 8 [Callorhinchus milii]
MVVLLNRLPAEDCPKFVHKVIDGVCGRALPRFRDYGAVWTLTEWMEILEGTTSFLKRAGGKHLSDEEILQLLDGLGLPHQEAVLKSLKGRKEELRQAMVEKTNDVSSAQLQDFDWQLKLPLSSDKIAFLQTPLLNLDLDVRENGILKPVSIEMNKEELQNLIHSLEAANKVVLQLK